jgi:Histidine kinase-, DNA gyrase B-, and HSP90-like ATPase
MQIRDSLIELRETSLYGALKKQDDNYAERIEQFVAGITPILATTVQHFPFYTRHDAHHGFRVVRRMAQVLQPACLVPEHIQSLGPAELFLLIAAAYAHDLGMTVFPGEEQELRERLELMGREDWKTDQALQDHLRSLHSKRGGDYIQRHRDEIGVPMNLVAPLDLLMKSHNLSVSELENELSTPFAAGEQEIDLLQLALVVCIADAIEFSDTRVMDGVFDRLGLNDSAAARRSFQENMKHVGVGDSLAVGADGRLIVGGTFEHPEVLALTHQTLDQMEGWIKGYADLERKRKIARLKIGAEPFIRNLKFLGGRFERLGIRLNTKNVIDLIASNAVWRQSPGAAVREMIQNAVEACRYRAHASGQVVGYQPSVVVTFDRIKNTVRIEDNGCGMSEPTVLNNFLTVGSSRAKEPAYVTSGYAPIARFGIGFWSAFTIADRVTVETAAFEAVVSRPQGLRVPGTSFEVSLDEMKDYTLFTEVHRAPGTIITLFLKTGARIDDIHTSVAGDLLCTCIPLKLVIDDESTFVPISVPDVSDEEIFGSRLRMRDEHDIRIYRWRGEYEGTELTLGLPYRMENGKASFLLPDGGSVSQATEGHFGARPSICGFSVPIQIMPCCFDVLRLGLYHANHRSPAGIEFALDRSALIKNKASETLAFNIWHLIHQGYRAFLGEMQSNDSMTIFKLNRQSEMHGGNVYDTSTSDALVRSALHFPDLYPIELISVHSQETQVNYVDLARLQEMEGEVFCLQDRLMAPAGQGRHFMLDPETEQALKLVYGIVRNLNEPNPSDAPRYISGANRMSSMLFDGDPDASFVFIQHPQFGNGAIQRTSLQRLRYEGDRPTMIASVNGRFSGTVYSLNFEPLHGKPYVQLGRYRMVVLRGSDLEHHVAELASEGRQTKIADLMYKLSNDAEGFSSEEVMRFMLN